MSLRVADAVRRRLFTLALGLGFALLAWSFDFVVLA